MRAAALQMDISWHERSANYEKVRRFAGEARGKGVDLLVLPEMFSTGFSLETSVTAEALEGPTPTFLRELARELRMFVVGGFVCEQPGIGPQNVSLAVDRKGNDLAIYAKIHLISLLNEPSSHKPGSAPAPFRAQDTRTACFICYDLRFPVLFQSVAEQCDLLMVIASWPAVRSLHWDVLLRARAIENQCYVLGVNRVGEGGGLAFSGGSALIDPAGKLIAGGGGQEALVVGDIDPSRVVEIRSQMPVFKDRMPVRSP